MAYLVLAGWTPFCLLPLVVHMIKLTYRQINCFLSLQIWSFGLKSFIEPFQNLDHILKWGNFSTSTPQTKCIVLVSQFLRDSLSWETSNIHPIFALCKKNLLSPTAISTGIGFVRIISSESCLNQIMCWTRGEYLSKKIWNCLAYILHFDCSVEEACVNRKKSFLFTTEPRTMFESNYVLKRNCSGSSIYL